MIDWLINGRQFEVDAVVPDESAGAEHARSPSAWANP